MFECSSIHLFIRSDFHCTGLAVQMDTVSCRAKLLNGEPIRVGTLRYMAPEVMANELDANSPFLSFLNADTYSLALIAWEMLQRTRLPPARGTPIAGCSVVPAASASSAAAASGVNVHTSDIDTGESAIASESAELDPPYLEPYFDVLPTCSADQPSALELMCEHVVQRCHRPPLEHLLGHAPVSLCLITGSRGVCTDALPRRTRIPFLSYFR